MEAGQSVSINKLLQLPVTEMVAVWTRATERERSGWDCQPFRG